MPYIIPSVVALLLLVWAGATFNRLVQLRNHVREAWADVDTELQRRHELIPRLVEVVRGYAGHEQELLTRVTQLREAAVAATGPEARAAREGELAGALRELSVRVEAYPKLAADGNFRQLQAQLVETEDRISAARRFYNANVRALNIKVEQLPSLVVARAGGFEAGRYFAADEDARAAPVVAIGDSGAGAGAGTGADV